MLTLVRTLYSQLRTCCWTAIAGTVPSKAVLFWMGPLCYEQQNIGRRLAMSDVKKLMVAMVGAGV